MRFAITSVIVAALFASVVGCGQSEEEKAREVAQDYVDARNAEDYERICELYSDEFKEELGAIEGCPAFVQEQSSGADQPPDLELVDVRLAEDEDRATAEIDVVSEGGGPIRLGVTLEREGDSWRISGLE